MRESRRTILVVDEDARTADVLSAGLSPAEFDIHGITDVHEALGTFLSIRPDFVLLGASPYSPRCMSVLKDICKADPYAQVIVAGSFRDGAFAMECIRQGAVDYLVTPIRIRDLIRSLERITDRRRMLRFISELDIQCVRREDKTLVFGNSMEDLPFIVNQAVCNARLVCSEVDILKTALGEILINAIEHGNLGITGREKSLAIERGDYEKLMKDRMDDPRFSKREVTLEVHMTPDELRYTVADQGDGFDYSRIFEDDPCTRIGSGLGLFIARSFFSGITYQGKGNRVVLVYKRALSEEEVRDNERP